MDDRFDNRSESEEGSTPPHLTPDQLTAYHDGDITTAERLNLDEHLRTCPACRRELRDLRSTVALLQGLPEYRPRRSFQLTPDRVTAAHSWWERLGFRLLPALPALRAATVATAILLVAVGVGDVFRDRSDSNRSPHTTAQIQPTTRPTTQGIVAAPTKTAGASAPTAAPPPPQPQQAAKGSTAAPRVAAARNLQVTATTASGASEATVMGSGGQDTSGQQETSNGGLQANSAAAPAAAQAAATETPVGTSGATRSLAVAAAPKNAATEPQSAANGGHGGSASDTSASEGVAGEAMSAPSPAASPLPTPLPSPMPATPTALPSPSSPAAVPAAPPAVSAAPVTGQPATAQKGEEGVSGWRFAEIGLAVLLAWLAVTVIGLQRLRGRQGSAERREPSSAR